jgi:hypothetical protein
MSAPPGILLQWRVPHVVWLWLTRSGVHGQRSLFDRQSARVVQRLRADCRGQWQGRLGVGHGIERDWRFWDREMHTSCSEEQCHGQLLDRVAKIVGRALLESTDPA